MSIKNFKNLNSPKYRVALASVILIGGGLVFMGVSNFGPRKDNDENKSQDDSRVRISPSVVRGSGSIAETTIGDYDIDDNSEMARVYEQKREDEREKALEGEGSFVITLNPDKGSSEEQEAEPTEIEERNKKDDKPKEENMDAQEPVSFQEKLRNTKREDNGQEKKKPDPMATQRKMYQQANSQPQQNPGLNIDGLINKAQFVYDSRDIMKNEKEYSGSQISTREVSARKDNTSEDESIAEVNERGRANSYAGYIGVNKTEQVDAGISVAAGDIFYTRLQIGINTDEISPVRAEILSGDLAGAVLLGYPKRAGKKAVIELDQLSFNGNSYEIDAVALDINTKRTGIADDVETHYGKNLFYLAVASIISGYSNSLQGWEETSTRGVDAETVKKKEKLDSFEDRLMVAIGEAGEETKQIFRDQINREPTVHVYPKDIAIMFMSEAVIGSSK